MTQIISQGECYRPCGSAVAQRDISEVAAKTQGEIEAAICEGMAGSGT